MKFAAYLALVGAAAAGAIKQVPLSSSVLSHKPVQHTLLSIKSKVQELPEWDEVEKHMRAEMERDGSVTLAEIEHGLGEWEKETGKTVTDEEWAMVEMSFAYADLNSDGHFTVEELDCVVGKGECPVVDDDVLQMHEMTEEMGKYVEEAISAEFEEDGDITLGELEDILHKFEDHFDVTVDQ